LEDYDIGKIFSDMESDLIRSMQRNLSRHTKEEMIEGFEWTQWQALKLKELKRFQSENKTIMESYITSINESITESLKSQFLEGKSKTDKEIQSVIKKGFKTTKNPNKDSFFSTNDKKLNTLIDAVNNDLETAEAAALRMTNDVYRKTIFRAQINLNFGAKTLKQAIDMATKDFLSKGINSIEYKDGRRINISSYSEMVLRTANKRAHLQGEGTRREEYGVTTVYVSQYNACSPTCIPWQGRVYVDDVYSKGKVSDGNYPLISTAIKAGLFHPNCRHGMSTFFPEINNVTEPINKSEISENYEYQQKLSYIDRNIQKYKRLESGSLDEQNKQKYNNKITEWKTMKKQHENGLH